MDKQFETAYYSFLSKFFQEETSAAYDKNLFGPHTSTIKHLLADDGTKAFRYVLAAFFCDYVEKERAFIPITTMKTWGRGSSRSSISENYVFLIFYLFDSKSVEKNEGVNILMNDDYFDDKGLIRKQRQANELFDMIFAHFPEYFEDYFCFRFYDENEKKVKDLNDSAILAFILKLCGLLKNKESLNFVIQILCKNLKRRFTKETFLSLVNLPYQFFSNYKNSNFRSFIEEFFKDDSNFRKLNNFSKILGDKEMESLIQKLQCSVLNNNERFIDLLLNSKDLWRFRLISFKLKEISIENFTKICEKLFYLVETSDQNFMILGKMLNHLFFQTKIQGDNDYKNSVFKKIIQRMTRNDLLFDHLLSFTWYVKEKYRGAIIIDAIITEFLIKYPDIVSGVEYLKKLLQQLKKNYSLSKFGSFVFENLLIGHWENKKIVFFLFDNLDYNLMKECFVKIKGIEEKLKFLLCNFGEEDEKLENTEGFKKVFKLYLKIKLKSDYYSRFNYAHNNAKQIRVKRFSGELVKEIEKFIRKSCSKETKEKLCLDYNFDYEKDFINEPIKKDVDEKMALFTCIDDYSFPFFIHWDKSKDKFIFKFIYGKCFNLSQKRRKIVIDDIKEKLKEEEKLFPEECIIIFEVNWSDFVVDDKKKDFFKESRGFFSYNYKIQLMNVIDIQKEKTFNFVKINYLAKKLGLEIPKQKLQEIKNFSDSGNYIVHFIEKKGINGILGIYSENFILQEEKHLQFSVDQICRKVMFKQIDNYLNQLETYHKKVGVEIKKELESHIKQIIRKVVSAYNSKENINDEQITGKLLKLVKLRTRKKTISIVDCEDLLKNEIIDIIKNFSSNKILKSQNVGKRKSMEKFISERDICLDLPIFPEEIYFKIFEYLPNECISKIKSICASFFMFCENYSGMKKLREERVFKL